LGTCDVGVVPSVVEEIVKGKLYFSRVEIKEQGKQAWSEPIVSSTIKERLSS